MRLKHFILLSVLLFGLSNCRSKYDEEQLNKMLCLELSLEKTLIGHQYSSMNFWDSDYDVLNVFRFSTPQEEEFLSQVKNNLCDSSEYNGCGCWMQDSTSENYRFVPLKEDIYSGEFYKAEYINEFHILVVQYFNI